MSTVRSEPAKDRASTTRISIAWNKIASIVSWGGGAFTTYLFCIAAMPDLPVFVGIIAAGLTQWVLTLAERPLWRWILRRAGGRLVLLALAITLVDGLLNAAGIYPQMTRLAKTDVGKMLAEVLSVQPTMDPRSAFFVAIGLGVIIAGLPEALWEYDERR